MTTKSNILKSAFIAASISAGLAVAYAFQPAKEQPTEHFYSSSYQMQNNVCYNEYCTARIKADDADVYVEYKLDDASVAEMEVINVIRFNESVNAEIDRYEIQKINAAIVGGVK